MNFYWNIVDDKMYFVPGERLEQEDWDAVRQRGFAWWRGSKQFVKKWHPSDQDYIEKTFDVKMEKVEWEDDVESRVDRFETYADNAASRASAAHKSVDDLADRIPLGQPILVGHHSEKRARRDAERIGSGMRKSIEESKKSAYWQRRAEAAEKNAARKRRPDVIFRRIKELEAEERKCLKEQSPSRRTELILYHRDREHPERAFTAQQWSAHVAYWQRWLDHVRERLAYEREQYAASGGITADKLDKPLEVGGAVRTRWGWKEIVKVNPKTVAVPSGYSWTDKIGRDDIKDIMTKAEWDAFKSGKEGDE